MSKLVIQNALKWEGPPPDFSNDTKTRKIPEIPNLYLWCTRKRTGGYSRSYVYRGWCMDKPYTETFGTVDKLTIWEAVDRVNKVNLKIAAGMDLHEEYAKNKVAKAKARSAKAEAQAKARQAKLSGVTVMELLNQYVTFLQKRGHWKSQKKPQTEIIGGWINNHFSDEFKRLDLRHLSPEKIAEEFHDLWLSHTSTPEKIIALLSKAYDWALRRRLVTGVNRADAVAVRELLPHDHMRPKASHHPFLPPELMPEFMADVLKSESTAAKCLAFQIFCALRIENAITAKWSQIDFELKTFTLPRDQMKVKFTNDPPHVVPLSEAAIKVLHSVPRFCDQQGNLVDYIFASPSTKERNPISERSIYNIIADMSLRRKNAKGEGWIDPTAYDRQGRNRIVVPHGLARTDFESWALDPITFQHEDFAPQTIDFIMDHKIDDYGRAYKRRAPLGAMKQVLDAWAEYLTSFKA